MCVCARGGGVVVAVVVVCVCVLGMGGGVGEQFSAPWDWPGGPEPQGGPEPLVPGPGSGYSRALRRVATPYRHGARATLT